MSRSVRWRIAALLAIGAALFALFALRSKRPAEPISTAATAATNAATTPPEPIHVVPGPRPSALNGLPMLSLVPEGDASTEQLFLGRMAETRAALMEKTRYPLESRPLAMKTDLMLPHHVDPMTRGLASPGHVTVTQQQDRVWVSPGQPATVSITAKSGPDPVTLEIANAQLIRHIDGQPDQAVDIPGGGR